MHYLLNFEKFKIYFKISLLHVSVYDHYQGTCSSDILKYIKINK